MVLGILVTGCAGQAKAFSITGSSGMFGAPGSDGDAARAVRVIAAPGVSTARPADTVASDLDLAAVVRRAAIEMGPPVFPWANASGFTCQVMDMTPSSGTH